MDYFPDKAEVQYAETFSVEYFDTYKVLDIFGTVYVLYQCGTPEPTLDDVTVQQYISIPVSKVATGTPDHIPRIEVGPRACTCAFSANRFLRLPVPLRHRLVVVYPTFGIYLDTRTLKRRITILPAV